MQRQMKEITHAFKQAKFVECLTILDDFAEALRAHLQKTYKLDNYGRGQAELTFPGPPHVTVRLVFGRPMRQGPTFATV